MKFLSDIPTVMAWDPVTNKPIRFVGGVYETKDSRIAALLKGMGFEHEGEELPEPEEQAEPEPVKPVNTDPDYDNMTKNQIVGILHKKGIPHNKRWVKEDLIDLLRGGD